MIEESKGLNRARKIALYLTLSAVFLAAGHLLVIQRSSLAETDWYKISPDAEIYLSMAEGSEVKLPFARRVLVPFLASVIPASPEQSLRMVTYVSLFIFYFVSLCSLEILGFSLSTRILAILAIFCCTGPLLLFQNPHIMDAFCHMCASIMLLSLLTSNAVSFGTAAIAGVLSHEMALFSVPSFLATGRWRSALSIIGLSFGIFVSTYVVIGGESVYRFPTFSPTIFAEAYLAWGIAWIPIIAGLCLCRADYFMRLGFLSLLVLSGATLVTLLAEGAVRMFTAFMPVSVVLIAFYIAAVKGTSRILFVLLLFFLGTNLLFALPTIFVLSLTEGMKELEDFYFRLKYPIVLFHMVGFALNMLILYRLRDVLISNCNKKLQLISDILSPKKAKAQQNPGMNLISQ